MSRVRTRSIEYRVSFDEAERGVRLCIAFLVATVAVRLELERLVNAKVSLIGRAGAAGPGRKVLTLVHLMLAGASHLACISCWLEPATSRATEDGPVTALMGEKLNTSHAQTSAGQVDGSVTPSPAFGTGRPCYSGVVMRSVRLPSSKGEP